MTTLEQSLSEITAFSIIHEHLFSSAQPSIEQLKLIKEYGCSTVINLALSNSPDSIKNEDQVCLEYGSVHDKFHRTLILSGFCLLKIAKISL
ncbi:hypothetical protein ACMDMP_03995, partial [Acinetobacter baumannii]